MKVLVIDYLTYEGHRNFNKIHVECLDKLGYSLHVVGRKSALETIKISNESVFSFFPKWMSKSFPIRPVSERIKNITSLLWIKKHFDLKEYDLVIFLIYDVLSLSFFRTNTHVLIINHNNVSQLWSKIKLSLTRCLPKNYSHITLNKEMEARLKVLLPYGKVYHIPHGLCPPSQNLSKPVFIDEGDAFLFCPINRNFDYSFIANIFNDKRLLSFLQKLNLRLYVKESLGLKDTSEEVVILPSKLNAGEYNYLIQNAKAVLLPYSDSFRYRCSGIFFECLSRHTPVISTRLESMAIYENISDLKMFSNVEELITSIEYYMNHAPADVDLTVFNPLTYWKKVIKEELE